MNTKLRFVKPYGDYRVGAIITPPGSLRKVLVDGGWAVVVSAANVVKAKKPTVGKKKKK